MCSFVRNGIILNTFFTTPTVAAAHGRYFLKIKSFLDGMNHDLRLLSVWSFTCSQVHTGFSGFSGFLPPKSMRLDEPSTLNSRSV